MERGFPVRPNSASRILCPAISFLLLLISGFCPVDVSAGIRPVDTLVVDLGGVHLLAVGDGIASDSNVIHIAVQAVALIDQNSTWGSDGHLHCPVDTLLGPVSLTLDSSRNAGGDPVYRIPAGARLRSAGGRLGPSPVDFDFDGSQLEHSGRARIKLLGGEEATWDSISYDPTGFLRQARLQSEWILPDRQRCLGYSHGPGDWYRTRAFQAPARKVVLLPGISTDKPMGLPDSLEFRWLDDHGRPIESMRALPEDSSDQAPILHARCGWLDGAFRVRVSRDSLGGLRTETDLLRLTTRRSRDTLFLGREGRDVDRFRPNRKWNPSALGMALPRGWALQDTSLELDTHGHFVFLPSSCQYSWERLGRIWQVGDPHDIWKTLRVRKNRGRPLASPLRICSGQLDLPLDGSHLWTVEPPLVGKRDSLVLEGLGTIHWNETYRWTGTDSVWARGVLVQAVPARHAGDPDRRWMDAVDVEGLLDLERVGAKRSAGSPQRIDRSAIRALRLGPAQALGIAGGRLEAFGQAFLVEDDSLGTRVKILTLPWASRDAGTSEGEHVEADWSERMPLPGGNSLMWTDGREAASVRGVKLRPVPRIDRDTTTARILSRESGITFAVDDVEPDTTALPALSRPDWQERFAPVVRSDSLEWLVGNPGTERLVQVETIDHAFIGTFVEAWNHHRPVRLSPDAVWMLLLEGMLERVDDAPEVCRTSMVRHRKGKLDIIVPLSGGFLAGLRSEVAWTTVLRSVQDAIRPHVVLGRDTALVPTFSTTTPTRAMASRLRVLDIFSNYFAYGIASCGIPRITLEGTPEDWRLLRERADLLAVCGLEPWVKRLKPVLDEFVRTSEGSPSLDFWRSFVRFRPADGECGSAPRVDGWITSLVPRFDGKTLMPAFQSLFPTSLPEDHGDFPFFLLNPDGFKRKFHVVTGFSGIAQSPRGEMYPELGWAVWEELSKQQEEDP